MSGYIRQDTSNNIATGSVINAADLDNEFDAVVGAFNSSSGHKHDGTSGEGAPITTTGPTQDVVTSSSALYPKTTNTIDLGTSTLKYKNLYLVGTANFGALMSTTADITSLVATTADINAGTIDATVIGGTTAAAGSFTSVTTPSVTNAGTLALSATGANIVTASTNGTERVRIDSSGNVAIGTATGLNYNSKLRVLAGSNQYSAEFYSPGSNNKSLVMFANDSGIAGIGSISTNLVFTSNGETERMRILASGAVSIGNTSDGGAGVLTVNNSVISPFAKLTANGTGSSNAGLLLDYSGVVQWQIYPETTTGALTVSSAGTTRLKIDTSGNVGIGTTTPTSKLEVVGAVRASSGAIGGYYGLRYDPAQANSRSWAIYNDYTALGDLNVVTSTTQTGATNLSRFYIDASGNVGINTTTPTAKLDVSGTVNATALSIGGTEITATATELNYVDGVTSAIQTQINSKANLESPTFTGTPLAPTAAVSTNTTQIATTAFVQAALSGSGLGDMLKAVYDSNADGAVNLADAWTTARTITIGSTGKSVDGSAAVTWTAAEIGINNSTLTLATSGIATGSQTFTSNQGTDATFTVNVPGTDLTVTGGDAAGPTINSSTGADVVIPSASATASGIVTTGTQTVAGAKTFSTSISTPAATITTLTLGTTEITATGIELNYVDGVTSAIQTQLNNKQASDAALTSISGLTTSANQMIYTTASDTYATTSLTLAGRQLLDDADAAAQLVTLGLSATAAELNVLDGITASVTELNYVDGVTSDIQTQLNAKQPLDADLTALAEIGTPGILVRTGAGTAATRAIAAGTGISIADGNGVGANPTITATISTTDTHLTGGYTTTAVDDGTKSTGTYTPSVAGGNMRTIINGGAFTLAAPTAAGDGTMIILITNAATGAGVITLSGFTRTSGSPFTTTANAVFIAYITKIGTAKFINVVGM